MATPFPELFGAEVLTKDGPKSVNEVLSNSPIVGIYFSAHWCPPCRSFTPMLVECYNKIKEAGKKFEVIFVSFDRDQKSFEDYWASMPWAALSHDSDKKEFLSEKYGVSGIPALVLLNDDGSFKLKDGRSIVGEDPTGAQYPW